MARSVPWKRTCSYTISRAQSEALNATLYILREIGPTGFILKDDFSGNNVKVYLGDPHNCSCALFSRHKELCKHLCWILLKKFRVPIDNPISFQLGLVEREINNLLQGVIDLTRRKNLAAKKTGSSIDGRALLEQKEISPDDACPICQDNLLSNHRPVIYCRFGCGNNIHIKCMKIWADHQKSTGESTISCPLCRNDFGSMQLLIDQLRNSKNTDSLQQHFGTTCQGCNVSPINGKCYKCQTCRGYYLCHECFPYLHKQHSFNFKQFSNQRWRSAGNCSSGAFQPRAVIDDLMNREITEDDYDLLLQLDNRGEVNTLPLSVINSLEEMTVSHYSKLLLPGQQCRVCLRCYQEGQMVRKLPCTHVFHKPCIDSWLQFERGACPVDGMALHSSVLPVVSISRNKRVRQHNPQFKSAAMLEGDLNDGHFLRTFTLNGAAIRPINAMHPVNRNTVGLTNTGSNEFKSEPTMDSLHQENSFRGRSTSRSRCTDSAFPADELFVRGFGRNTHDQFNLE